MPGREAQSFAIWKGTVALLSLFFGVALVWATITSPSLLGKTSVGAINATLSPETIFWSSRQRIDALPPGSPLALVGARVGDYIEYANPAQKSALLLMDEPVRLTLSGTTAPRQITVPASLAKAPLPSDFQCLLLIFSATNLLFALAVGFKRPESLACRALTVHFLGNVLNVIHNITMPGLAGQLSWYGWAASMPIFWGSLIFFALYYPEDRPSGLRQRLLPWSKGYYALLGLYCFVLLNVHIFGRSMPLERVASPGILLVSVFIILASLAEGWRRSKGEMRQRHLWILASFGILAVMQMGTWAVPYDMLHDYRIVCYTIAIGCNLAIIYAILRFRIFDFGFAFNRALVYSVTSLLLLIAFGVTEWLAEHFLHFEAREKNVLLDGGIALGVYLAFHRVRHAVEHFIEHIFFQRWHKNEAALRLFVARAAHFVSRDALLAAFGAELERFTQNAPYAIYQRDSQSGGFVLHAHARLDVPRTVDLDDGVAVSLRMAPVPIALKEIPTALSGEFVLPMAHRAELDGFILIGSKPNHEGYRQDELAVLGFAAHQVGLDLHAARIEQLEQQSHDMEQRCNLVEHEARVLREQLGIAMRMPASTT